MRLLLVAHHLVVDGVSWRILVEDLDHIGKGLAAGEPLQLPSKTTSYQQWAEALVRYRANGGLDGDESDYWLAAMRRQSEVPRDYVLGDNTVASASSVAVELTRDETEQLVRELPRVLGSQIQDVLLAALVQCVTGWTGHRGLLLGLEGHGREEEIAGADLSRTVGWFTTICPVWLPRVDGESWRRRVERIRDLLAAIPRRGIGYGLLRYIEPNSTIGRRLAEGSRIEIGFNYLGQFDHVLGQGSFFRMFDGAHGANKSELDGRDWVVEINSAVSKGRFRANWSYSRNLHRAETVEAVANAYVTGLRELLADCCGDEARRDEQVPTLTGFDPRDLDTIRAGIKVRSADGQS